MPFLVPPKTTVVGMNAEGNVVCISPGINGKWDVSEKGFEAPLASFDDKEDAYAYATDLRKSETRHGGIDRGRRRILAAAPMRSIRTSLQMYRKQHHKYWLMPARCQRPKAVSQLSACHPAPKGKISAEPFNKGLVY